MTFAFEAYPRKLNLGCGFDKKAGFLNIDINAGHDPDLVCDVTDLSPLPSGHYSQILAMDILEHIPRLRVKNTLREWNRTLKKGGRLDLQVPNVTGLLSLLLKPENQNAASHEQLLQCLFGTQAYPGDFHFIGFTEVYLRAILEQTGFVVKKLQIKEQWLFWAQAKKISECRVDPIFYLSDESFIDTVFETFLKRKPDPEGRRHYLDLIRQGVAREAVIRAIETSEEYKALSSSHTK